MTSLHLTSARPLDDGVVERDLRLGDVPGTLWTPASGPAPLVLMAHNNGLPHRDARLVARARHHAAWGYAVVSIDAAGCGDRPRTPEADRRRDDVRRAVRAGEPADDALEALVGPLVAGAVPEWRAVLEALLELPELVDPAGPDGAVGFSGWAALGLALAAQEPRVAAAALYMGGYVPRAQRDAVPRVTAPLLLLLQWDDAANPRERVLALFDAAGSTEKTLHANPGGHLGTPWFELDDSARFLDRHLR